MAEFPRTEIGGVSVSRMVAGSNWWLGYTHQTRSRSELIKDFQTVAKVADMLEVFLRAGIDVTMGPLGGLLHQGREEAEQRVGRPMRLISTPNFDLNDDGPVWDSVAAEFDKAAAAGATFCWPHTCATDRLYDGLTGTIRHAERLCEMVRERGMIPGWSTHLPQVIVASDKMDLDVASYISIYNAAGFLMPVEIDWVQRTIHNAKHPVTTIKSMAAGRLMPYVGLPFSWATLRDCDLVTVGTTTPDEAREAIEISLAALERRAADRELQTTRSKEALQ
jgi:hypothetical protein